MKLKCNNICYYIVAEGGGEKGGGEEGLESYGEVHA